MPTDLVEFLYDYSGTIPSKTIHHRRKLVSFESFMRNVSDDYFRWWRGWGRNWDVLNGFECGMSGESGSGGWGFGIEERILDNFDYKSY